ncbi:hypothetical protein DAPPUDRAFT_326913 [Daphnia pulex]|uniref:Uncharacterized protein n=1 Tax=Daphnia pulex TaxID=6669 RepID=E9H958_DAPPU|nr:hypothetical protein DAPPUDRAFT_326913 [Daphnia pulex]|eukprot:EFX71733.1 hypothetical protein DAPPUDRAFT_326913 [Daphnia pulex]
MDYTLDYYRCGKCQSTHYSWLLIYEKHLKYRETSDDESSDKEDVTPDVESSQGESDSYGDLSSGNDTRDDSGESEEERERKRKKANRTKKAKKAKLALEANNNTSDEDSDLSSAFSDCSLDEDNE